MVENSIRLAIFVSAVLQVLLLASKAGSYCTQETGILKMEGNWLLGLSVAQAILMIVFAVWKWSVYRYEKANLDRYGKYQRVPNSTAQPNNNSQPDDYDSESFVSSEQPDSSVSRSAYSLRLTNINGKKKQKSGDSPAPAPGRKSTAQLRSTGSMLMGRDYYNRLLKATSSRT